MKLNYTNYTNCTGTTRGKISGGKFAFYGSKTKKMSAKCIPIKRGNIHYVLHENGNVYERIDRNTIRRNTYTHLSPEKTKSLFEQSTQKITFKKYRKI